MIWTTPLINLICLISVNVIAHDGRSVYYAKHYYRTKAPRAHQNCSLIARRAISYGLDPVEVISLSYVESGHSFGLVSSAGARGPLQVLPKYSPKLKGDRDWINPALRVWRWIRTESRFKDSLLRSAGRYNGGGAQSTYARRVQRHAEDIRRKIRWIR